MQSWVKALIAVVSAAFAPPLRFLLRPIRFRLTPPIARSRRARFRR